MNTMNSDVDPLGMYDYSYDHYNQMAVNPSVNPYQQMPLNPQYPYDVKIENVPQTEYKTNDNGYEQKQFTDLNNGNITNDVPTENPNATEDTEDVKDIKPVIDYKIKKERKYVRRGKQSSYWSKKILDENFKFYGCAVCNVDFATLNELDQHVTIHKDRITSYDLKLQNQKKRKLKKKELKRMKNKKEELEIKPEDGYIGNEKATEYNGSATDISNGNQDSNIENDSKVNVMIEVNKQNGETENIEKNNKDKLNLEKIYKCFACQKQFTLSYYLKLHVRSHTDEKPYTCSICGQSFITASKLGRHNKRIHLSIRYQCRICFRFFTKFECLTRHFDKQHPDDKLEGEPYDYNAILPYLKELEEQLIHKKEDPKPKPEDPWDRWLPPVQETTETELKVELEPEKPLEVLVEDVKVNNHLEIEVKCEEDIKDEYEDEHFDDGGGGDEKDGSGSDDNYFPSNTWVPTPKAEVDTKEAKKSKKKTDPPLQCEICQKKINSMSYYRVHMRTHTGERPFKCYLCDRGFITASKMHRHVLTHKESWQDEEMALKQENVKLEDDEDGDGSDDEKKPDIKKKRKPKTTTAKKARIKKDPNDRHLRWQHTCEFCHRKFLHLETLQVHKKSHAGEELVHKCHYCLTEFPQEGALKEHEATHTGPKPYLCTICGRYYKRREAMIYHKKQHQPEKEYVCDICSKSFTAPCKLQRHIARHSENKFVLRYECPVCAHMFNTKYHVQMHLASHQKEGLIQEENRNEILAMVLQNARKFPKQGDTPSNLTDVIPSDERSRICNICGEIFQHFYYLEEHLKSHGSRIAIDDITREEEKKHICKVCNKGFKLHYYLKLHSFTHTKEKPYTCQQCGKGFITKGKLKRHIETHTGLKKYQCHICCKFFTRTSYLRIHVRTIHGTQDYNFRLDKDYMGGLGMNLNMGHHSV